MTNPSVNLPSLQIDEGIARTYARAFGARAFMKDTFTDSVDHSVRDVLVPTLLLLRIEL